MNTVGTFITINKSIALPYLDLKCLTEPRELNYNLILLQSLTKSKIKLKNSKLTLTDHLHNNVYTLFFNIL